MIIYHYHKTLRKHASPLGFEPATLGSADTHPNHYTTAATNGGAESRLGGGKDHRDLQLIFVKKWLSLEENVLKKNLKKNVWPFRYYKLSDNQRN